MTLAFLVINSRRFTLMTINSCSEHLCVSVNYSLVSQLRIIVFLCRLHTFPTQVAGSVKRSWTCSRAFMRFWDKRFWKMFARGSTLAMHVFWRSVCDVSLLLHLWENSGHRPPFGAQPACLILTGNTHHPQSIGTLVLWAETVLAAEFWSAIFGSMTQNVRDILSAEPNGAKLRHCYNCQYLHAVWIMPSDTHFIYLFLEYVNAENQCV